VSALDLRGFARRLPAVAAILALAQLSGATVAAQDRLPGTRRPQVPDTTRLPIASQEYRAWTQLDSGANGLWHAFNGKVHVTIAVLDARTRAHRREQLLQLLRACAGPQHYSTDAAERLAADLPWTEFDLAASGVPTITVTATASAEAGSCAAARRRPYAGVSEGVWPAEAPPDNPLPGVADVEVLVDRWPAVPLLAGAVRTKSLLADSIVAGPSQVRLYLGLDAFGARADGTLPSVQVRVLEVNSPAGRVFSVPDSVVARLWVQAQDWYAARAQADGHEADAVRLPLFNDDALGRARELQLVGRRDSATTILSRRLAGAQAGLSATDRVVANLQLGLLHAASGNEPGAQRHLESALRREPCLRLPASTDSSLLNAMDRARPIFNCTPRSSSAALRAGWRPGGAQITRGGAHRTIGKLIFAATVTAFAAGAFDHVRAQALHKQYQTEIDDPTGVYLRAEEHRTRSLTMFTVGTTLWLGSAMAGAASEINRSSALADLADFGTRRTRSYGDVEPPRGAVP
jgi:hypothetical protein